MEGNKTGTEERILQAAREVFMQKGYDGTSMQMIADAAGIHKSLLHYYFRSKQKLFGQIFSKVFSQFIPHLGVIFMSDMPLEEKVWAFADRYIDVFIENPLIPVFVMHELSRNPDSMTELIRQAGIKPEAMMQRIVKTLQEERIVLKDPRHFLVSLIGLCVFPFAARPLIQKMMFGNDEDACSNFLQERKREVPRLIMNAIRGS